MPTSVVNLEVGIPRLPADHLEVLKGPRRPSAERFHTRKLQRRRRDKGTGSRVSVAALLVPPRASREGSAAKNLTADHAINPRFGGAGCLRLTHGGDARLMSGPG